MYGFRRLMAQRVIRASFQADVRALVGMDWEYAMNSFSPVMLIGHTGLLGTALRLALCKAGREVITVRSYGLELGDPRTIKALVPGSCSTVINCAALTDPDTCERDEEQAMRVNAHALSALGEACKLAGATLVHFSTSEIFSGGTTPFSTEATPHPVNVYAASKLAGESALRESGCEHLIIRTSWLFAPWGNNFVRTVASLGASDGIIHAPEDQTARPTCATRLALRTLEMIDAEHRGTCHVANRGACTLYELACEVARLADRGAQVRACPSTRIGHAADRPEFHVLDTRDTDEAFGALPDWQLDLAEMVRSWTNLPLRRAA
jgi:dTDP-4-dehydrorhamnose reductase